MAVPLRIKNAENIAGMCLLIQYDPQWLTYESAVKAREFEPFLQMVNENKPGVLAVLTAGAKGVCAQKLTVLYLYFKTRQFVYKKISPDIYIHGVELLDDQPRKVP